MLVPFESKEKVSERDASLESTAAIKIEIPSPSFITLSSHCFGRPLIPPDSSPTCHYPVRDQGRPYPSFPLQLYPYTNFNSPPIWPCP